MNGELKPTARLRFIEREMPKQLVGPNVISAYMASILQQWWAPDVPAYMVDPSQGEWRDVPLESGQ